MELKGKLIQRLTPVTGTSSKGDWTKQEIIIETAETYPKKICIGFWKDEVVKIQAVPIGSEINVHINVESREYNGRWYTEVKAWKFEVTKGAENPMQNKPSEPEPIGNPDDNAELPF